MRYKTVEGLRSLKLQNPTFKETPKSNLQSKAPRYWEKL
jgi:hypothetical protein